MEIAFLDVSPFYINVVRIHFEHFLTKHTHQATTWQGVAPIGITHLVKGNLNRLIAAALSATVSDPGTLDRRAMENHGNTGKPMGTKHRDVANPIINGRFREGLVTVCTTHLYPFVGILGMGIRYIYNIYIYILLVQYNTVPENHGNSGSTVRHMMFMLS